MKKIHELLVDRKTYSIKPTMSVYDAVEYMCERKIGAVAVCEHNKVMGVFSERDLMGRVVLKGLDTRETPVAEVMTHPVVSVMPDDNHRAARTLMLGRNFRHLVVVDEHDQLQGFISMRELIEVDLQESRDLVHKLNDNYYEEHFQPGSSKGGGI